MYRPDFPFVKTAPGYIEGWSRRFYQGSTDHRGVPGAPGRVVTLIRNAGAICWGRLYWVGTEDTDAVLAKLDHREKNGYEHASVDVLGLTEPFGDGDYSDLDDVFGALTYRATPDNAEYLGPAPLEEMVSHIASAEGPSGSNTQYVLDLADALRDLVPVASHSHDAHVFALAQALRAKR